MLDAPIELTQDLSGGCGGKTWEAADVMVDYILWKQHVTQGQFFQGKRVLELGAGTGLVGLAVAKGCPNVSKVIITDQLPMMHLMEQNIKLNNLRELVEASVLDWGVPLPPDAQLPDVILASDCVYLEAAFKPLLDTLVDLSTKDTVIYMSYRKRRRADRRFFQMARKKFDLVEILDDPKRETYYRDNLKIFLMKKKYE
ncbi:nicotinamide N-methyltransferase-like protein [Dichotomocladium elegans]|nr:nicotinamide N-methyltransferase-like protein [Dichotomocladium elegans]